MSSFEEKIDAKLTTYSKKLSHYLESEKRKKRQSQRVIFIFVVFICMVLIFL
jgi:hypothetical protein